MPINILIIDSHHTDNQGVAEIIGRENDFKILSEFTFNNETIALGVTFEPLVVIIDTQMVGENGIEIIEKIKQQLPNAHILTLTGDIAQYPFYRMINTGALGYILRDSNPATLLEAIRTVARGEAYIQPLLLSKLLLEFRQLINEKHPVSTEQFGLTRRELEIVSFIALGKSNKDIAEKLYISEKTVKNHVSNILKKMALEDRTQVAVYAYQQGLLH